MGGKAEKRSKENNCRRARHAARNGIASLADVANVLGASMCDTVQGDMKRRKLASLATGSNAMVRIATVIHKHGNLPFVEVGEEAARKAAELAEIEAAEKALAKRRLELASS